VHLAAFAEHYTGQNCMSCHTGFALGGHVFGDKAGSSVKEDAEVALKTVNGSEIVLEPSDSNGCFSAPSALVKAGRYLCRIGNLWSRSWHDLPSQAGCNSCHTTGGNGSSERTVSLPKSPKYHTVLPKSNNCMQCHFFPSSQSYAKLKTVAPLNIETSDPSAPASTVTILDVSYPFDPSQYSITALRSDIFNPGHFSMFDVILAVADKNGIDVEYAWDEERKTHFISSINSTAGDYWYQFGYSGGNYERRTIRWDEAWWKPGTKLMTDTWPQLGALKNKYSQEISKEAVSECVVPRVSFNISPSDFNGNPDGSGRISASKTFNDVAVSAHNLRADSTMTPFDCPFRKGVITAVDVLFSLQDQGSLSVVASSYYSRINNAVVGDYYIQQISFPGTDTACASGSQGFTFRTDFSSPQGGVHVPADIHVIHNPDIADWTWTELGNPFYEASEPAHEPYDTSVSAVRFSRSVADDHEAIVRGFNFHEPVVLNRDGRIGLSFNVFEPGRTAGVSIYDGKGRKTAVLFNGKITSAGRKKLDWNAGNVSSGAYFAVMTYGKDRQIRKFVIGK
jgi:hypothetical protein